MKRILIFALASLALLSCKEQDRSTLLPNVSGKAGELIVMMEKPQWEGELGEKARAVFADDCPFLPVREPLYTLINVVPSAFNNLFRVHRNILYFNISQKVEKEGVEYRKDVWASPQIVIDINARTPEEAIAIIDANAAKLTGALEQAERERVIRNARRYEQKDIAPKVAGVFGGSPHFPAGYVLRKISDDFAWVEYDRQGSTQGILIYKYPATPGIEEFSLERIISQRDAFMKANVPGMFDGTYMTTASPQVFPPYVEYIKFQGREFAQTRGLWEVKGDFMGGPFVSESFYSRDGKEIIVTEAFLYYPNKDKRLFLRQIESILYSWEWAEEDNEKNIEK